MVRVDGLVMVTPKWRFNFRATSRLISSSSSGVALAATEGEMFAPATTAGLGLEALASGVAETDGDGEVPWPNRVETSAIEQRQVRSGIFIGILTGEMRPGCGLDSKKPGNV